MRFHTIELHGFLSDAIRALHDAEDEIAEIFPDMPFSKWPKWARDWRDKIVEARRVVAAVVDDERFQKDFHDEEVEYDRLADLADAQSQ